MGYPLVLMGNQFWPNAYIVFFYPKTKNNKTGKKLATFSNNLVADNFLFGRNLTLLMGKSYHIHPSFYICLHSELMVMMLKVLRFFLVCQIGFSMVAFGQVVDSTQTDDEDYSQYGSADESVKYCTQKVRLLSPTKLISIGYEGQAPFEARFTVKENGEKSEQPAREMAFFGGARIQVNAPVISNNRFILNLAGNYAESGVWWKKKELAVGDEGRDEGVYAALSKGLRTGGISATAFKPLDDKRFMIFSAMGDFSGNYCFDDLKSSFPKPTLTFAALYGWKKNENTMLAFGATQTWRGGERLYVPLLLFNKTFNDKWGLELLLPARAHVRYNFSPQSLLLGGFEIEGNSFRIYRQTGFVSNGVDAQFLELRRSELKFRLIYEQKITGFIWLSVQAGWRFNYKFQFSESRSSDRGQFVVESKLGNPVYAGISLNLVSP